MYSLLAITLLIALANAVQVKRQVNLCSVCVGVVGYAEQFAAQGKTQQEIVAEFDNVCPLFGSFQPECEGIVSEFLPAAVQHLANNNSPTQVCQNIALCDNTQVLQEDLAVVETPEAPEGGFCTICEAIVGFAESYLEQNTTVTKLAKDLDQLCALTPFDAQCKELVKKELPAIIHYLEKNETPPQICAKLGVCSIESDLFDAPVVVAAEEPEPEGGFCTICITIATFVDSYLEQNHTEAEIATKLDKVCGFTGPYESECKALVKKYLPEIIKYVEKKETPSKICAMLGVCQSEAAPATSPAGCALCKTIVGYVEMFVQQNATEQQIATKIKKFCKIIKAFEMECENLVDNKLPVILANLAKKETPAKVCAKVNLCDDSSVMQLIANGIEQEQQEYELFDLIPADQEEEDQLQPEAGLCGICELFLTAVESWITENKTEAEIALELNNVCTLLHLGTSCTDFIKHELPRLIAYIEKNESPSQACTQIGVCTSDAAELQMLQTVFSQALKAAPSYKAKVHRFEHLNVRKSAPIECAVCQAVVGYGDHFLTNNQTITKVEAELDQFCSIAGQYKSICETLVKSYVPYAARYVQQKASPATVCEDLGVCTK